MSEEITFESVAKTLLAQSYTFAKTMPEHPHWYVLRKNWTGPVDFEVLVQYLRDHSTTERFKGRGYKMFYLNGHKYWTMGAPLSETTLINRAVHKEPGEYDSIADQYVEMFQDAESRNEERELFSMLKISGRVLDIGCGHGLLLDYVSPEYYVGIDPSQKMLDHLLKQHPEAPGHIIRCKFEEYYGEGFDTIVSLFGAANYIPPAYFDRIKRMLAPGGKAYLMFYAEGYEPVTHIKTGINPKVYRPKNVPMIRFHNYDIFTYENL